MSIKTKTLSTSVILGLLLFLALLWAYWPVFELLATKLLENEDFSYGLLLPLVSGYLVYLKWPQIRNLSLQPAWQGFIFLALGMLLYIVGEASTDLYSPSLSFVVSLSGILILFGGWNLIRLLWFPLFLLVMTIPLPNFLFQKLTFPLQMISSWLATGILQAIGIPAVRQGNVIDLGARQLQVVSACSGLRYILSLLALGMIFCYFYQRRPWKVVILLLSVIPAAIIANALRVAAMGVFPILQQDGFWHTFSGWLIFVFCFALLYLFNWVLSWGQGRTQESTDSQSPHQEVTQRSTRASLNTYLLAALLLVVFAGYGAHAIDKVSPVPLLQSFDNFPLQLGAWQGKRNYIDSAMLEATGATTYLDANFEDATLGPVSLWIAYYENQKVHGSVHSPFTCLSGSGWLMKESTIIDVAPGLPVHCMVMEQGSNKYVIYYWYLQRGRWLTSEYLNKFYLSFDNLLSRRADGALIRLITPAMPDVQIGPEAT